MVDAGACDNARPLCTARIMAPKVVSSTSVKRVVAGDETSDFHGGDQRRATQIPWLTSMKRGSDRVVFLKQRQIYLSLECGQWENE